ncbi:MAG: YhdP family protein [Pseudomonadota bacterium]
MKTFTRILDKLGFVLATCIVFAALLVSITRLLTPVLMEHRADFEKFVSAQAGRPVLIREINIRWHGYQPQISLEGITILDLLQQTPTLKMDRLEVDFNIWRTIWTRKIFIQSLTVSGIDLTVHHQDKGHFEVANLGAVNMQDTATGNSVQADLIFNWVFSQPRLALKDIEVHYIPEHYPPRSITLKSLALRNSPTHHVIDGSATLNQEMPVNVDVHLGWDGDIRKLPEANGHVYLYFEGLSLPQWFGKLSWKGLQITQGLASTKLWVRWNNNHIYKMQSAFEVYNLELYSSVTKNAQMINRISGNLGWKIANNVQTFAGDEIYLDLPAHLWPATNFNVQATGDADDNLTLNNVKFNYADIADVKHFILMTSLLSDEQRKQLLQLGGEGEVTNFQAQLPADLKDVQHLSVSGTVQKFNIDAWQQFPAIKNFSGSGSWNGKEGSITLTSNKTSFNASHYFDGTIALANLTGDIKLSRDDAGTLTVNTKNLHIANADLVADVIADGSIPQNDSATVNINAKYAINNLAKLASYLPAKIMDPDLVVWLKNAFVSGQINAGTAVIQGNMKDFPFTANNGKFLVDSQIKDLDFNYGPHWPHLTHVNGELIFAGSAMKAEIHSATLLNIPVQDVHGEIPYIGDLGPQIVNVNTTINTDLANGLLYIRQSPLQKTIGKDFNGVVLTGPMQLKLSLSIPAKKPETATVLGTITTTSASMGLPAWKLIIDKLAGAVTFTEKSLTASNMQSEIFAAPATINITTADKSGQINIALASNISVNTLENWLNLSFNNIVQGATDYQVQLLLSPPSVHGADQLLINSNLQGVDINLPAPYAKKAVDPTVFQAAIDLNESKYVKIKLTYAKLLSAALSLQKDNQQLTLYGGEIKLGSNAANWQTAPGVLVSGQTSELDVATWEKYFDSFNNHDKNKPQNNFKLLRGIDLSANVLRVMNVSLHNAHVNASMNNTAWDVQMSSNEIGGSLTVPFNLEGATITGHLDHLTLDSKMAASKTARIDPRTLPAMVFTIDNASFDEMKFGHVNLNLQPFGNGIEFKELNINEPGLQLTATGQWTSGGTRLQGTVNTPRISEVLKDWGFNSANLIADSANFNFNLAWPGPPYAPSLGALGGTLNVKFGEGKIINLSDSTNSKIGLGKLLNIFSLSSIPRHLSFNSKDSTAGFNFDSMTGDFTFRNGSAYTENMRIEGPVAAIAIKGRIGLVAKDLDLHMGVNAHVTGSLPLVAAFAGGPIVGVATLVVDKVVTSQMSKVTSYDYTVTNSWANPVWQKASGGR